MSNSNNYRRGRRNRGWGGFHFLPTGWSNLSNQLSSRSPNEPLKVFPDDSKQEAEWAKTQRRFEPLDNVERVDLEILRKKINALESALSFSEYQKIKNFPGKVIRIKEEFNEIIDFVPYDVQEEDNINFSSNAQNNRKDFVVNEYAVYCDLRDLKKKKYFQVGQPIAEFVSQNENSEFVFGLELEYDSFLTDPLGEYKLWFPDQMNWSRELEILRERFEKPYKERCKAEFSVIKGSYSNYSCIIQSGLMAKLEFKNVNAWQKTVRVVYTVNRHSQYVYDSVKKIAPSICRIRKLSNTEICSLMKLLKNAEQFIEKDAYELQFSDEIEAVQFVLKNKKKAMRFPASMDERKQTYSEVLGMELKWQPYPFKFQAELVVKDHADVGYALWVLSSHGFHAHRNCSRFEIGNRSIEIYIGAGDIWCNDIVAFHTGVIEVMKVNNVETERVSIVRCTEPPPSDQMIKNKIQQRLGRAAMNQLVWELLPGEKNPSKDYEWFSYVNNFEHLLPWTVDLNPYKDPMEEIRLKALLSPDEETTNSNTERVDECDGRLDGERSARVVFKDRTVGIPILNFLVPISPRWDTFTLSRADRLGVRFDPFFEVHRHMPPFVRVVLDSYLKTYDEELRKDANVKKRTWLRLRDDVQAEKLIVEGWPEEKVHEVANKIDKVLKGVKIDCSDPNKEGKLIYGIGLSYVNKIQEKYQDSVVIFVCRLQKFITLIGEPAKLFDIKEELIKYCANWRKFIITTSIKIDKPRFLVSFLEHLRTVLIEEDNYLRNSLQPERLVCNGIKGTTPILQVQMKERNLIFIGNPIQYERLQEMLDKENERMLSWYKKLYPCFGNISKGTSNCPVCLCNVSLSNFRLSLCGHLYCLECLCNMISYHIQSRNFPIKCLHIDYSNNAECGEDVALHDILRLTFGDNFIDHPHYFPELSQMIVDATTEYSVNKSQGEMRYCNTPDCAGVFSKKVIDREKDRKCEVCGIKVCSKCFYPPHPDNTCEVEVAVRGSAEMSLNYFMVKNNGRVKRCPNKCGGIIEKDAGCNHMHCQICKIHFCWLCEFTSNHEPEIYEHMRTQHNGFGGPFEFLDNNQPPINLADVPFPPGLDVQGLNIVNNGIVQGPAGANGFPMWIEIEGNRILMEEFEL